MDRIDRDLLVALIADGRATYQDLGRQVRLSPNTVAHRVRRLRESGVISGFHAGIDPPALGRSLRLLVDVSLREDLARADFERRLAELPQVVSAVHLTGEYDYELGVVCAGTDEFETVLDALKHRHGVHHMRSRLVLREVPLGQAGLVRHPPPA